jgi:hypothetical protein
VKDYIEMNGERIDLPDIALGKTVPYYVEQLKREEYLRKKAERKADLYFVGGLLGTLAGTILGWLLAKFF